MAIVRTTIACGEVSTVYLTVTATPSTNDLAVDSTSIQSAASADLHAFTANLGLQPTNAAAPLDTSSGVTATTTIFLTYTEAVEVAQVTATSSTAGNGEPYYFTEHDGTTAWLSGKAPSATQGLITGTTTVLVAPIPTEGSKHTTSTETVLLTLTTTKHLTKTVVEAHKTAPTSVRSFTGLGASGWNGTATTLQTVKVGPTGSGVSVSGNQLYQTGIPSSVAPWLPTGYTAAPSAASTNVTWKNGKRQVGSIVVATINGVVVSWTNAYDGGSPATSVASSPSSVGAPGSSAAALTTTGYALESSFQATSPVVTSFQPLKASGQTIDQTAAPTTVTVAVQSATNSTIASTTVVYPPWSAVASSRAASAPTSTTCGETGSFTIDFDDLPSFSTGNNDTADYPPIFNPYHHLDFSGGYSYAPPPTDPFQPISPPHLAVFAANLSGLTPLDFGAPDAGSEALGEFGAGDRAYDSAYWIDAYGAAMGCDNKGPEDCIVTFSGFAYSESSHQEVLKTSLNVSIPPCPALKNCILHPVSLGYGFTGLSGLSILARVADKPVIWFMDDVQLAWSNNTCAAGLERSESR
ncbi:MAG: hypothetical protein M1830_007159 [Pleopsidium flavum]|nr:MAG: hypothetical protein M1830_007159 [Pleopsidium flavum]